MIDLLDVPLFRGLEPEVAEAVASVFTRRRLEAGDCLFRQGDRGDSLVIVLDGLFELIQDDTGEELHLADVPVGRILGLVSLVDPGPRTATLRALEDGEVAVLDQNTFNKLWDSQGDAAARLHHQLCQATVHELRSAERKLLELLNAPVHEQLPAGLAPELAMRVRRAILGA